MIAGLANPEYAVIGLIMANPETLESFASELKPDDFQTPAYRRAFELILDSYNRGVEVSLVTMSLLGFDSDREVMDVFLDASTDISGAIGRSQLPITMMPRYFIKHFILQRWKKKAGDEISSLTRDLLDVSHIGDASELSSKLERVAAGAALPADIDDKTGFSGDALALSALKSFEARSENQSMISTGLKGLDEFVGGFQRGTYYTLGGVTGTGKTLFGTNFANAVLNQGKRVVYISIEMEKERIADRFISARSGLPCFRISNGTLTEKEKDKLFDHYSELAKLPLTIRHFPGGNLLEIEGFIKRLRRADLVDFVVIDYLQDLHIPGRSFRSDFEKTTAVTVHVRELIKELKIPILNLVQLNRDAQSADNIQPTMKQIRGSGQIENDSEVLMLIYHDKSKPGPKGSNSWILLEKNRHGPDQVRIPVKVDFVSNRVADL